MTTAKFCATHEEILIIGKIANRAENYFVKNDFDVPKMALMMDIEAVHYNGCELRLKELLAADDANFIHDVMGIITKIDRETGELTDCFVPRYAK